MHNMVMNHRGKTRSKGMGIETQLKQVDIHFVFSINRHNFKNHIIDRITDNGTFRGFESVERGDGFLETRRLQRPSSHRCNFPQALLALTRSHKAHSTQENKLVSHLDMPHVHRMNSKVGLLQTSERRESSRTPVTILHPKPTEGWVIVGLLSSLKQQIHAPIFLQFC